MVVVYARLIISYAHLESDAFTDTTWPSIMSALCGHWFSALCLSENKVTKILGLLI